MTLRYLLDSDILIHLQRGHPKIIAHFETIPSSQFATSAVNKAEVYVGCFRKLPSRKPKMFFDSLFERLPCLPFDDAPALVFAEIKSDLGVKGNLIADLDIMIASIALSHRLTLVTNNIRDFGRIRGLKTLTWSL